MAMKNRQLPALVLSGVLVISTLGGCSAFGQLAKQTVETGKEYYDQNKDSEQEIRLHRKMQRREKLMEQTVTEP